MYEGIYTITAIPCVHQVVVTRKVEMLTYFP